MGISLGLLSNLGVSWLTTDQIYNNFFAQPEIQNFEHFHEAFLKLCKFFNDVMPGKHFEAPKKEDVQDFYNEKWSKCSTNEEKKKELTDFVQKEVKDLKIDNNAIVIAGLVVPAAAVMLKNATENTPSGKRFKLHLIPKFVFVPTCTLFALAGVQLMQIRRKSKSSTGN